MPRKIRVQCRICGERIYGNHSAPYCQAHSRLASEATFIRNEINQTCRDGRYQHSDPIALELWQELSYDTQYRLSLRLANLRMNYPGKLGAVGALELAIKVISKRLEDRMEAME